MSDTPDATLYAIPGSHACEAGALMLEHKRIPYRRKDFPPGLHSMAVRMRGFPGKGKTRMLGDRFLVFHRGNGERSHNAVAELDLGQVMSSLVGDRALEVEELERVRAYDLGTLEGTPLCFSDATTLSDDLVVFTASAEDDDGRICGSVVGTLDPDGEVERLRTIDRKWKVEGVHAAIDARVIDFVFVCDQDSGEPSPLLSATMPVESGFERREG